MADETPDLEVLGATGLTQFAGIIHEEWLWRLRGQSGMRIYKEMRDNDATIGAVVWLIQSLIRQAKWEVEPAPDSGPEGEAEAEFYATVMEDMETSWPDLVSEILSMVWFGYSLFELLYKTREGESSDPKKNSRFDDGRVGIRDVSIRAQETIHRWEFDDEGALLGAWQVALPDLTPEFLPSPKLVHFRTEVAKNNPEGRSFLRNAFVSWAQLKRIEESEAIGIERELAGLPVVFVPEEFLDPNAPASKKKQAQQFLRMAQKVRRGQYEGVVFPHPKKRDGGDSGFDFQLMTSGGKRQINTGEVISRKQKSIAGTIAAQFIFLGMDGVGSLALSSDQTDIFAAGLGSIMDIIEETWDRQVTRKIMCFNGVPREFQPRWKHGDLERQEVEKLGKFLLDAVNSGVLTPDPRLEDWLRRSNNLPPKEEGEPVGEQPDADTPDIDTEGDAGPTAVDADPTNVPAANA